MWPRRLRHGVGGSPASTGAAADALGDLVNQITLKTSLSPVGGQRTGARDDSLLWLRATKPFGSPDELPSILAEIAGPGVFRGFELRRRAEFAEQTWEVAGQVDPAAALPELLDTLAFNRGLEEQFATPSAAPAVTALTRGLSMRLSIDLPGELRSGGDAYTWDRPHRGLTHVAGGGTADGDRGEHDREDAAARRARGRGAVHPGAAAEPAGVVVRQTPPQAERAGAPGSSGQRAAAGGGHGLRCHRCHRRRRGRRHRGCRGTLGRRRCRGTVERSCRRW